MPRRELTYLGLMLIAIGTGGIKPCVSSFGGEQFTLPQQARQLAAFFSVFYFSINAGSLISTYLTPELRTIQCLGMDTCYPLSFGVPAILMIVAIGELKSLKKLLQRAAQAPSAWRAGWPAAPSVSAGWPTPASAGAWCVVLVVLVVLRGAPRTGRPQLMMLLVLLQLSSSSASPATRSPTPRATSSWTSPSAWRCVSLSLPVQAKASHYDSSPPVAVD